MLMSILFNGVGLRTGTWQIFSLLIGIICLPGCSTSQAIARPEVSFTEAWQAETTTIQNVPIKQDWWQDFQSPELNRLLLATEQQSPDLRIAAERVRQAELQMKLAGASLFPAFSLSATSGTSRNREVGGDWTSGESSRASLGASYEVDLWGKVSASVTAAEASFNASQYDYEAVRLSLAGGVTKGWFQWLALQQQLNTAAENISIAQRVYDIVDIRYRNGVATSAEVARQRTNLLTQQAALLPLQLLERQTRSALAILVGQSPQVFALNSHNDEKLMTVSIPSIAAGVPADIIVHRPDLASVEAQLQAADADVSAARRALLPSVQLSASAGKATAALFSLNPAADTRGWSLSLAQSLFDRGRLRNQLGLSESRRIALVESYRKAIYGALQETEDALDRIYIKQRQEQSQIEIIAQAERSLTLTEVRYKEGSDDLLALLDAQRSLFQAQDQLAQQRLARLNATVDLYQALGGGWLTNSAVE